MNKKKIIIYTLIIITATIAFFIYKNMNNTVEVSVAKTSKGYLEKYIEDTGKIYLSEQQIIYASASGYISDLYFETGESLSKGNKLLDINSSEIKNTILQRNKILEEIKIAERNLEDNYHLLGNKETLKEAGALSPREYTEFYNLIKDEESRLANLKRELYYLNNSLSNTNTKITAPMDGVLLEKYANKGDFVSTGTPLLLVGDTGDIYIEVDVLTSEVKDINKEDKVLIYNTNMGIEEIIGKVSKIHPIAFSKVSDLGVEQNRVKVKIEILDDSNDLKPGYNMDLKIITDSKENVIFIPENAVFQINSENYVFVVKNEKAELKKIVKGMISDRNVEIIEGLDENETIITSPPSELEEGSRVIIQ